MDDGDPRAATFDDQDLSGARFNNVDLSGSSFRSCALHHVTMRGVEILDATIDGEIEHLVINGVNVAPLIEAELDRRDPDRVTFRPSTPAGFREAWDLNERLWAATVERARRLPEGLLHESIDGEWSFIQTLRHLAFATESWVVRCVLGVASPWHPLSLPWDQMSPRDGVPRDRDARPSLTEALSLRLTEMAHVRRVMEGLTDEQLDSRLGPLVGIGWPDEGETFVVRRCLGIMLNEEWWHRLFAERDLAILERRRQ